MASCWRQKGPPKNAPIPDRIDLWIQRNDPLFLEIGAGALELDGRGAESFGNVLVGSKALEIDGVEHGKHVHGDVKRCLGIVDEVADNGVVLAEIAVAGDKAKDLIGEARHCSESFDFLVGDRKSTRLNSSHLVISYAVFCLKKKTIT